MKKVLAWRAAPLVFLLVFYWSGLTAYFYQDDFGWLNLHREIHSPGGLLHALFAPKAHGNMRPLGDNGYFIVFGALFGVEPLPYRIWTFLTQAASLLLLGSIVRRLTASEAAGFWAQVLWVANCSLAVAMTWTCVYNQVLCGFFFLLAFRLLLKWIDTGEARWYAAQWAALVLGLGSLETFVMYPVLAAAYTWLYARKRFSATLPMFAASAAFAAVHFAAGPPPASGVYALHFGPGMAATLWTYWKLALGPASLAALRPLPPWFVPVSTAALTAGAAVLMVRVRRSWTALLWFAAPLAPLLPLTEHVMDYYLAVPAIGIAMLGAWGIAAASSRPAKAASAAAVVLYLAASLPAARAIAQWHHDRSKSVETLVLGVEEIRRAEPDKIILLTGVDTDLFLAGMVDVPFRVMGIPGVYLAPGSTGAIRAAPEVVNAFVLPEAAALREMSAGRAVVYEAGGPVLRNVTGRWRQAAPALWRAETPRYLNVGDPLAAPWLGPGWGGSREGSRAMGRHASLRIGGPRAAGQRLRLAFFCGGSPGLRVRAAGAELTPLTLEHYGDRFDMTFALPEALAGRPEVELAFDASSDLAFGFASVR